MDKRWNILQADESDVQALHDALKIHPILCRLLIHRSIRTFEEARTFFRPPLEDLHSPWLMKDMDKAVNRILTAISSREKVLVFGDYDVDGTTAVACMYTFLRKLHNEVDFYVPHR